MLAAAQTSRREKIQTAAPSPTAIQAMIHTRYSGSGGSAAKNGLLAAAAPAPRTAVMMPSGSSAQIAPRHIPSVGSEDLKQKHRADYDARYQARILAGLLDHQPRRTGG